MALNPHRAALHGRAWVGGQSNILEAFPRRVTREVRRQQEARPKPTSCTGFLDWPDKKNEPRGGEAAALGRMGRLGTPLSFGCIGVTLHRAVKGTPGRSRMALGAMRPGCLYHGEAVAFLGKGESEPR